MARSRGGTELRRLMRAVPELLSEKVLPGAARAGANVIAGEAKQLLGGREAHNEGRKPVLIADSVKVRVSRKGGVIRARVLLEGPGAYVGRWLEYGTLPHFISVDPSVRGGMTARRINKRIEDGDEGLKATLIINGQPVGTTVFHPGAGARPFMRPAADTKETEARAAAVDYVRARVTRRGIVVDAEPGGDEQ